MGKIIYYDVGLPNNRLDIYVLGAMRGGCAIILPAVSTKLDI